MTASTLLTRVRGVKPTGSKSWISRCPGHDDKHPSLAIRELDDGRVLIHCFAGCTAEEVLSSISLTFSDLYPTSPPNQRVQRERLPFNPIDVLRCIRFELLVVCVAAGNVASQQSLTDEDRARLQLAQRRIHMALEAENV